MSEERTVRRFRLLADAGFYAADIDDALAKLSEHFADVEESSLFEPGTQIKVERQGPPLPVVGGLIDHGEVAVTLTQAPERITEAELREIEGLTVFDGPVRQVVAMRLAAEVRRLRALIATLPMTATTQGMDAPNGITCELRQLVPELDAEARAIREEGGEAQPAESAPGEPRFATNWLGGGPRTPMRVWVDGEPFVPEKPPA